MQSDIVRLARARLLIDQPWLSELIMRLTLVESPECQTTATDGKSLFYAPEFFGKCNKSEQMMLIAHEAMHAVLGHCDPHRVGGRQPSRWNIACDYAINLMLDEAGMTLADGALVSKKYTGMTAEAIYAALPKKSGGGCGGLRPGTSSPAERAAVMTALAAAAQALKRAGRGGSAWQAYLDEAAAPPLDWRDILRAELSGVRRGSDDFSWRRPSRRGMALGCYLPSQIAYVPGPIAIAIDTSGSMAMAEIAEAVAIVRDVSEREQPDILVMLADQAISAEVRLAMGEHWEPGKVSGGGGTDFRPAQRRASELGIETLVYVSDMAGPMLPHEERGATKTIWITRTRDIPKNETVIKIGE